MSHGGCAFTFCYTNRVGAALPLKTHNLRRANDQSEDSFLNRSLKLDVWSSPSRYCAGRCKRDRPPIPVSGMTCRRWRHDAQPSVCFWLRMPENIADIVFISADIPEIHILGSLARERRICFGIRGGVIRNLLVD